MKKEVIFTFLICILLLQFAAADTTFFEGDLEFVISPSTPLEQGTPAAGGSSGGGSSVTERVILENELDAQICEICFESIKNQVKEKRTIEYTEQELEALTLNINTQLKTGLSKNYVLVFIENFEDKCDRNLPLIAAFAGGRYRDLLTPLFLFILIIILISLIILYLMFRRLKKLKRRKK